MLLDVRTYEQVLYLFAIAAAFFFGCMHEMGTWCERGVSTV